MYLSIRDITFARGRFALIGAVVALITLLLVLLTGLTQGLGHQNTSALERLDAEQFIFSAPVDGSGQPSFTESQITDNQLRGWQGAVGDADVERIGVTQTRAQAGPDTGATSVAVLALEAGTALAPDLHALDGSAHPNPGEAVLSQSVAEDLDAAVGDTVELSTTELIITGITQDEYYSHLPVVWAAMADYPDIAHLEQDVEATALALTAGAPAAEAGAETGTVTTDTRGAFAALPAYQSERGSLLMMQGFLYGISALVVVSFLTVWTIQRTRDIAVLRALGASRPYLVRDSLGQAAVVLLAGVLAGGAVGAGIGAVARTAVPFTLSPATALLPAAGVFALGVAGSLLAVRRVSSIDPLLALGGN
ncbi:ABC transporter permease [Kocuria rosea]|uniref:ABC transporter permease n=1 Tax=Kocuria rosea TaxID=1275 RepID=UPI00232AC600|nr:ABC transporter permease [Kocuria rosea]